MGEPIGADFFDSLAFFWGAEVTGLLCNGPCDLVTGTKVVDAFHLPEAYATFPAGITWDTTGTSLVGQIDGGNADSTSFLRVAFQGAHPDFFLSDWSTGPATF